MFTERENIWRFLTPKQESTFGPFLKDYELIRRSEGREALSAAYYNSIPYVSPDDYQFETWKIRAKSYEALVCQILTPLDRMQARRLRILDLGAGNGWLSHRLCGMGAECIALDLVDNDWDGLAAAHNFDSEYLKVQATFDELPFSKEYFDLVIFNASLHYSRNYATTLTEALRVLHSQGQIVVMDTPIYKSEDAGKQMAHEKHEQFEKKYGIRAESIKAEEFLTHDRLGELSEELKMVWNKWEPFYDWKWRLRPLKAKLRRRRELARFFFISGLRQS